MRKGFTLVEVLIVVFILLLLVALVLPAIFAARDAVREQEVVTEEIEITFEQGDFAYLVLDGRKVQVTSVQNQGVYLVRYADNTGHLEKISLFYFELTDDYELRQTLR